jgi:hypothetical protein
MAKNSFAVVGAAVAVTSASSGVLTPPSQIGQGGYDQAIIANNSPWLATFITATGTSTVQPFSVDIVFVDKSQQLLYQMALPPGGSASAPAFTYLQADWYAAGNPGPAGTYPYSLPMPVVNVNTIINPSPVEIALATVPSGTLTVTVTPPNTIETLVMVTPSSPTATVTVQGVTTGYDYPVIQVEGGYLWWAAISSVTEPGGFQVTFVGLSAGTWYVLGDIAPRLIGTQDFADGTLATAAPGMAVQIGGRDASNNLVPAHLTANNLLEIATCASNAPTVGQVTITGSATAIAAARAGRTGLTIYLPIAASGPINIGTSSAVTFGTGDILEAGESVTYSAPIQYYGITGGASIVVSYEDE